MKPVPTVSGVPQDVARGRVFVLIDAAMDAPLTVEAWECPDDLIVLDDGVAPALHYDHGPRCKLLAPRVFVASDEVDDVYDACEAMFGTEEPFRIDRSGRTRSRMYAALEGIARLKVIARSLGADEGRVYAGAKRGLVPLEVGP